MAWDVDGVQFALFTAPVHKQTSALDLWKIIFKQDPDYFNKTPGPGVGGTMAGSQVGDVQYSIATSPGRIDIRCSGTSIASERPPQMENLEEVLGWIRSTALILMNSNRPVRCGIVVNQSNIIENSSISEVFTKHTGIGVPFDSLDLVFQINRPIHSKVFDSLLINRLGTWITGEHQFFEFGAPGMPSTGVRKSFPFMAFNIDINTSPSSVLPENNMPEVLDELMWIVHSLRDNGKSGFAI